MWNPIGPDCNKLSKLLLSEKSSMSFEKDFVTFDVVEHENFIFGGNMGQKMLSILCLFFVYLFVACGGDGGTSISLTDYGQDVSETQEPMDGEIQGDDLLSQDKGLDLPPMDNFEGEVHEKDISDTKEDTLLADDASQVYDVSEAMDNADANLQDDFLVVDNIGQEISEKDETCKRFYQCVDNCAPDEETCVVQCQSLLSFTGSQRRDALEACIKENACDTAPDEFACIEEHCIVQYFMCFQGYTYTTCVELIKCVDLCPSDDPSTPDVDEKDECEHLCSLEATFGAQMDLFELIQCVYRECGARCSDPGSSACEHCWEEMTTIGGKCEAQNDKCVEYGDKGCNYLVTCLEQCAGNEKCEDACFDATTKQGLQLYLALEECISQACPICESEPHSEACDDCYAVVQEPGGACYSHLQACIADTR